VPKRGPRRLTDDEFNALLDGERDPFKLAILGVAALEAEFVAAIEEAFVDGLPDELRDARWRIRLALVDALGLLPSGFRPIFDRLATIRNRFAHGEIHEFTRHHSNTLADAVAQALPELGQKFRDELKTGAPLNVLRAALLVARLAFAGWSTLVRERRAEDKQIVLRERRLKAIANLEALHRLLLEDTGTSGEN